MVESCTVNGPTFIKFEPEMVREPARPEMFENEEAVALREERLRLGMLANTALVVVRDETLKVETDCKLDRVAERVSVEKLPTRERTLSVSVT